MSVSGIASARPVVPPRANNPALAKAIEGAVAEDSHMDVAHWGMVVCDENGQVLYQHDADHLYLPASNLKMLTAATANAVLGTDARFTTRIATDGTVDDQGVLHGNLALIGGGDPSLATSDLKAAIGQLGIKGVDGNILVDDHVFDGARYPPGWAWDDMSSNYSAEIDGLTLDENVTTLHISNRGVTQDPDAGYLTIQDHARSGSRTDVDVERVLGANVVTVDGTVSADDPTRVAVTMHDPALYAGTVLKSLLSKQGISVSGTVQRGQPSGDARDLWSKSSEPLLTLEKHMLKESDNLYGETLFHALAGGQSSQAASKVVKTLGISSPVRIVDGCGLSRDDLISPNVLVHTVQGHYKDAAVRDCLPIAGVDGTLRDRMPSLKGRVWAKTGTMGNVSTLSGWLHLRNGQDVSFAWMCNNYPTSTAQAKATEDRVMVAIDNTLG